MKHTSIAPKGGVIGGLIALVAAAMGFLAAAGALTGIAADRIAGHWSEELSSSATIRIIAPEDEMEARIKAALLVAQSTKGVTAANALTDDESRALLAPWLGPDADIEALPVPALIDVKLGVNGPDAKAIQARLEEEAPGAVWDDHRDWRSPLVIAARVLRQASLVAVLLSFISLGAMVAVAATATLWSKSNVLKTLKLIGAEDRFISRAFERRFAFRAAIGGGAGALVATIIAANIPPVEGVDVFAPVGLGATWWFQLGIPVAAAIIASINAIIATRAAAWFALRRG